MRKPLLVTSLAVAAFVTATACDLASQLTAQKMMVGTVLSTPEVDFSAAALADFDASFPPDAGFAMDAGSFTLPPQTAAFVFFGERERVDSAPTPITDATITVTPVGSASTSLENDGNGNYSRTSLDDNSFAYVDGATYQFTARLGGKDFVGEVKDAPTKERIARFHPPEAPKGYIPLAANTPLTFMRPTQSGQELPIGFVTVFPVSDQGQRGEPTYTNLPSAPLEFLELIAAPVDWRKPEVTIPGEAFPQPDTTYVILFQAVRTGGPKSTNLFTGSALLAGTADVGVVRTNP